ncbi:Rv3654c family TadE-like protein [Timonella sp. A28]|uniref:Rv3654c family TadE-like protein n=1 Tax=Timonella sp. A28 TaxID=3442640 RepID=UPI003EB9D4E7
MTPHHNTRITTPEAGSASIITLAITAVIFLLTLTALVLTERAYISARTQTAADLAALAAANQLVNGTQDPCAVARETVRMNNREKTSERVSQCQVADQSVFIAVHTQHAGTAVNAYARAGARTQ